MQTAYRYKTRLNRQAFLSAPKSPKIKLACKAGEEVDEFRNLKPHLDIEPLEMVDSWDDWGVSAHVALDQDVSFYIVFIHGH